MGPKSFTGSRGYGKEEAYDLKFKLKNVVTELKMVDGLNEFTETAPNPEVPDSNPAVPDSNPVMPDSKPVMPDSKPAVPDYIVKVYDMVINEKYIVNGKIGKLTKFPYYDKKWENFILEMKYDDDDTELVTVPKDSSFTNATKFYNHTEPEQTTGGKRKTRRNKKPKTRRIKTNRRHHRKHRKSVKGSPHKPKPTP